LDTLEMSTGQSLPNLPAGIFGENHPARHALCGGRKLSLTNALLLGFEMPEIFAAEAAIKDRAKICGNHAAILRPGP